MKIAQIFKIDFRHWIHYVMLIGLLYLWFLLGNKFLDLAEYSTIGMLIFWFIGLVISDRLIHIVYLGEK